MQTVHTITALREVIAKQKAAGKTVGFAPTMGNLHEGHITLIREGHKHADFMVSSIFVNPTQFNNKKDFSRYPRNMKKDLNKGLWDTSAAGHVDAGEDYTPAAIRETQEELGINIESTLEFLFKLSPTEQLGMEFIQVYRCLHNGPFLLNSDEIDVHFSKHKEYLLAQKKYYLRSEMFEDKNHQEHMLIIIETKLRALDYVARGQKRKAYVILRRHWLLALVITF